MRIGGGRFRGRSVRAPTGRATRPTSGRLKKSLFDILAPRLEDARFLDLFAGAGAVGLEALSRGAAHVTFVERGRHAAKSIQANLAALGLTGKAELSLKDAASAVAALQKKGERFDLVFVDPPYGEGADARLLAKIEAAELLTADGLLIVEHHHKTSLPDACGSLKQMRQVRAGESCLSFYARK